MKFERSSNITGKNTLYLNACLSSICNLKLLILNGSDNTGFFLALVTVFFLIYCLILERVRETERETLICCYPYL